MQENHSQGKRFKKKRRRSENSILAGSILLCIVTLTAVTICLVMVFQYRAVQQKNTAMMSELEAIRLKEEAAYSQAEVDALIENAVEEAKEKTGEEVEKGFLDRIKGFMTSGPRRCSGTSIRMRLWWLMPGDIISSRFWRRLPRIHTIRIPFRRTVTVSCTTMWMGSGLPAKA